MPEEMNWLRERLEGLEKIERPSASEGERQAAEWLVGQFAELGALAGLRGRRLLGALLGGGGAAGIADDFPPGQRRLRRILPKGTTYNVVCELGDPAAERTIGLLLGLGSVAAMTDIGLRKSVPAANDNGSAVVALLALARLPRGCG